TRIMTSAPASETAPPLASTTSKTTPRPNFDPPRSSISFLSSGLCNTNDDDFDSAMDALRRELAPPNFFEAMLVEQLILAAHRLRRRFPSQADRAQRIAWPRRTHRRPRRPCPDWRRTRPARVDRPRFATGRRPGRRARPGGPRRRQRAWT